MTENGLKRVYSMWLRLKRVVSMSLRHNYDPVNVCNHTERFAVMAIEAKLNALNVGHFRT